MALYILAAFLNFLVNFFLLLGTEQIAGITPNYGKSLLAAAVGGIYAAICLKYSALGGLLWRLCSIALMNCIAFGRCFGARGILFLLQQLAISGIAAGLRSSGIFSVLLGAAGVCLVCLGGFWDTGNKHVPVELSYGARRVSVTALRDTGNTLKDPITGRSVLVLGADAGQKLTGLTQAQLCHPVENMTAIPGLRLIPYHTIDKADGLLLGLWIKEAKVGRQKGGVLVALAPERLSEDGKVQALTGGMV